MPHDARNCGSAGAVVLLLVATGCDATAPVPASPHAELARLDGRAAEPLSPTMAWEQKQKMLAFLGAVEQITTALAREDWEAIETASAALGPSPQQRAQCGRPPSTLEPIDAMALAFRCRADAIGRAAQARDHAAVLRATSRTLQACNTCHAMFRQELIDEATGHGASERAR